MYSFETLLHASSDELIAIFAATRVGPLDDNDARREQIAQQLGLKVPQLMCGVGFNAAVPEHEGILRVMGYAGFEGLATARNFAFIHDTYHALSINNILEIYGALHRLTEAGTDWSDLVLSRNTNIESQLEETINPVLIGGYKLEVRAIYENKLASDAFINGRLTTNHRIMRDIANEKRRVIFQGLIPPPIADRYIRQVESEEERRLYREALESASA